ncbi:hypothetical protein K469DRAFT_701519 [Zopfia rhizophila CBS 207.26]|uniref:Zn(2)-C6 fungal-type domain-containing protein n=1 Tax=Zopfia rhizophila CBS 207.26 TaxID=1314779 RepID=A0A6A6DCN2_9PEZI|nr:hypothetical protein K469DRAFT_701519 [Zopfia rhizophila CBS 207.26]
MSTKHTMKKRKACQACTHAKAKCSPFENRSDLCYRCQRLNKQCMFENAAVRKGRPKQRSRVKQLEERVESLVNLLTANGQSAEVLTSLTTSNGSTNDTSVDEREETASSEVLSSGPDTPGVHSNDDAAGFDAIVAGLLSHERAGRLLNTFRNSFAWTFPFVIIPKSATVDSLRRDTPFLFLSIMAVMTYETPSVQHILGDEFKAQIASRIICQSQKSLEILQGLLVHAAWYHCFFRIRSQQLAIILQLCVAMIQDLGLSKNPKDKTRNLSLAEGKPQRSANEKRAFLGTYYLLSAFAQAWRKRTMMNYTKYMEQCCRSFADEPVVPTDMLVWPFIHLSELMCRVNNFFSYDDIENAEARGEIELDMSMNNFRSELERIRDAVPTTVKQNTTLTLQIYLLQMWIHESSLHCSLWSHHPLPSPHKTYSSLSTLRIRTLYLSLNAMKAYLNSLLETPQDALYHFAFQAWSGWFYASILACKLVFLQENEPLSPRHSHSVQQTPGLLPEYFGPGAPHDFYSLGGDVESRNMWDPVSVVIETGAQHLFNLLLEKLKFTMDDPGNNKDGDRDPLFGIACVQRMFLAGFERRLKKWSEKNCNSHPSPRTTDGGGMSAREAAMSHEDQVAAGWNVTGPLPDPMNFGTLQLRSENRFDYTLLGSFGQQNTSEDWMWNMMMEDFTMPAM